MSQFDYHQKTAAHWVMWFYILGASLSTFLLAIYG